MGQINTDDYVEDLAVTTAYIYAELMDNTLFFSDIDKAVKIAKDFIKKYPTGTDWEKTKNTWEETLYYFCLESEYKIKF